MKRPPLIDRPVTILAAILIGIIVAAAWPSLPSHAATQSTGYRFERETGRQKLTPTVSTALTLPTGTTHAEFWIEGGAVFYRWDGGTVADTAGAGSSWNASK